MGVNWTTEQQQVITTRNRNILVSAAAGSGKTAVLVERIITRLTKDEHPLDVDRLLIVTFTEAAAAEMKERILGAIESALDADPENEHLRQQATLIHSAMITTIHSFCLSVIRDHFHAIDLDPGFRIAEEGELKLLKHDVIQELLEEKYQEARPEFIQFVERFATGKNDKNLEEMILKLHEYARSYPDMDAWLDQCVQNYEVDITVSVDENPLLAQVYQLVQGEWQELKELLKQGMAICHMDYGPIAYEKTLLEDMVVINQLIETKNLSQAYRVIANLKWARLAANRNKETDPELAEEVKELRAKVKDTIGDQTKRFLFCDPKDMIQDIHDCQPVVREFMSLVQEFAIRYQEKKAQKSIIDFGDMEQFALQVLTEKKDGVIGPSKIAAEYQERFEEVMIDEYQDSNLIQETILTSVSKMSQGVYNVFMVGDVKQSIYSFRLSRPELFMEKYDRYQKEKSEKEQRIDLFQNFRSRREVLEGCNFVFYQIMRKEVGGITYDKEAALYLGADYRDDETQEMELLLIHTDDVPEEPEDDYDEAEDEVVEAAGVSVEQEEAGAEATSETVDTEKEVPQKDSARELEARGVARRIKELVGNHQVKTKDGTYRPAEYRDIVILTRSLAGWSDLYADILTREGIPAYTGSKEGYFETREIRLLLDYLRILDNPLQDIPLASVLTSVFGNITSEELALIKVAYPSIPFYEAVPIYGEEDNEGNVALQAKLRICLEKIASFRAQVPHTAIHELLWKILVESDYLNYVTALPGGMQRRANVEMLLEKAKSFESTSYKGLFHFVRYIEQLQKYEMDFGEANISDEQADTVRIMSIHKSKGLEFPIVFVVGLSKKFNMMDQRSKVVLHSELGAGIDAIRLEERTKNPTIYKKMIQYQMEVFAKGEELRILYVAMTRAKEKLILAGGVKKFDDMVLKLKGIKNQTEFVLSQSSVLSANSYMDWIVMSLCRHRCFGKIWERLGQTVPVTGICKNLLARINVREMNIEDLVAAEVQEETKDMWLKSWMESWSQETTYSESYQKTLKDQFSFVYPYDEEEHFQMKFTVSEIKKRVYMEEESGVMLVEEPQVVPMIPKFLAKEQEKKGAFRGTAYHRVMELLDFEQSLEEDQITSFVQSCVEQKRMTEEMGNCIEAADIKTFLDTPVAARMGAAKKEHRLFVEQPFVLGVPAEQIYHMDSQETILVQGIIDVYFEEEDGLVVLDYKTDRVKKGEELVERYHAQLDYYAKALEQMTGRCVKEKLIYSFTLQQMIKLP